MAGELIGEEIHHESNGVCEMVVSIKYDERFWSYKLKRAHFQAILPTRGQFGRQTTLGANENILAHSTEAKSLRETISNICEKIIKIWCTIFDIGSKGRFSVKKGFFGVNSPLGANENFFSKIRLEHFFRFIKM